jgi:predicted transcriptional regulator
MRRKYNSHIVKRHFTYTIKDIAALFGTCEKTVQRWIAVEGLAPVEGSRNPYLISGAMLSTFLSARTKKSKTHLQTDEFYCVKCRVARKGKAESIRIKPTETRMGKDRYMGIKMAECEVCGGKINRFFTYSKDEANKII